MTPEEKAQELIEKFKDPTQQWDEIEGCWEDNIDNAKQCAIILCEEFIKDCKERWAWDSVDTWQRIKTEIDKL